MNLQEAGALLGKLEAVWPQTAMHDATRNEWLEVLVKLDAPSAFAALEDLRLSEKWRPSIADFATAAKAARQRIDENTLQLPAGNTGTDYRLVYGQRQHDWVYCWKCGLAVTLEEQATTAHYREGLGLCHSVCPAPGMAPKEPVGQRNDREAYWQKRGIEIPKGRRRDA